MTLPFEYSLKRNKRSKSLKIKIEQGGKVVVVAPYIIPEFLIKQFVKKNSNWVTTQLSKLPKTASMNTSTSVSIFGKKYKKEIEFSSKHKIGVFIKNGKLVYNPTTQPVIETQVDQKKWDKKFATKLEFFLKNTASHYLIARTHKLADKMNTTFNNITLRKQKTRWGSCSSQKNLNFNWRLVHYLPNIIDYVIIHELAHLVHMNHSSNFWSLVSKYDPEYLNNRGFLKRCGMVLG